MPLFCISDGPTSGRPWSSAGARVHPLEQVQEAYRELEAGHTRGKIVLVL